MVFYFCTLLILFIGAFASLVTGGDRARRLAPACGVIACALGVFFAVTLLTEGITLFARIDLPLPLGQRLFHIDPLSAVFLLPVFILGGVGCFLLPDCMEKLWHNDASRNLSESIQARRQGAFGFFFLLLIASIIVVLTVADGIFFLISWEVMSLTPFFLLLLYDINAKIRFSGWVYLIVAHLGALPLLLLFAMLSVESGGSSFFVYASMQQWQHSGWLFCLALLGFGVKLGLFPLHIWMPETYPAVPRSVSVVLSGAMINVGIYGLLRILSFLGTPEPWWGYMLMAVGGISGLLGVLFALTQADIKRSLAYSSAENMGIICLSLGAGLAASHSNSTVVLLFVGGALLHMWNHSLFKSLLFLGATTLEGRVGTVLLHQLGGLQKRMPVTGACMALGCVAIAGLPPLSGFMGELLMGLGFAFGSKAMHGTESALLLWAGLFALVAIAGLALFCFTRLYGLAFLGAPRSELAAIATEEPKLSIRLVMSFLALCCLALCLASPFVFRLFTPVLHSFMHRSKLPALTQGDFAFVETTLWYGAAACLALIGFMAMLLVLQRWVLRRNGYTHGPTWDCGYIAPAARMQYTGGSFAHSLAGMSRYFLRPQIVTPLESVSSLFPSQSPPAVAQFAVPDWILLAWGRFFNLTIGRVADAGKALQHGIVNVYILYILLALIVALTWALEQA